MTPYFSFSIKIFLQNHQSLKKKNVLIALLLYSFTLNDLPLSYLSPNDPFFARKLLPMAPWFDALVGASPSLLYESAPPLGLVVGLLFVEHNL